jgi:hypothetical protein
MKAVLVKEKGEYILHKYAEASVVLAMSDHDKSHEQGVRSLDKRNCDSIFGVLTPQQMSEEYASKIMGITKDERDLARVSYHEGLIARISSDTDNRFNEKDLMDALIWASSFQGANQTLNEGYMKSYIDNLTQKKKVDAIIVEIEMHYLPVSTFCFECGKGSEALTQNDCNKKYACNNWFPKYDDNGCLILKKFLNN